MPYSVIEKKFEEQCHTIHPDIDANMFLKEYNGYEQCIPLLSDFFTKLHQYIHDQLPNIDMSFTARLKAKKSFLDKKILKISENIFNIFPEGEFSSKKQLSAIQTYLSFLPEEKFNEIKKQILACTSSGLGTKKSFKLIFDDLSDEEKQRFIKRISRTSDTFAYSFIVKSISYPIQEFKTLDDNTFAIVEPSNDSEPIVHTIQPSIKFNPETDIVDKSSNIKAICVNGKEYPFNPEYLLYSPLIPAAKRNIDTALRDSNGMVTLLQDSIVLSKGQTFPVENITFDTAMNSYFLTTPDGERINLTSRLAIDKLTLRKYDEATCETAIINTLKPVLDLFNNTHNLHVLTEKDYINNPKLDIDTGAESYKALHNCLLNLKYKYKIEGQLRTFFAHILYHYDHDAHKHENVENQKSNPILSKIYQNDKLALDGSTATLMNLLESNPDIDILDLMAIYFVTTTFPNGLSDTYFLEPETTFIHMFGKYSKTPSIQSLCKHSKLDFSSYANFIESRAKLKNESTISNLDIQLDDDIPF